MQKLRADLIFLAGFLSLGLFMLISTGNLSTFGLSIFWESIVPAVLASLVLLSHDKWRLVCPLASASMFAGRMKISRFGRGQRLQTQKVKTKSWLGKNHIYLQLTLLTVGLALRVTLFNHSPYALGVLILLTLSAAIAVGFLYSGRTWCHYFCPMGPVEAVLTGHRSIFGSNAHTDPPSVLSQSACRLTDESGQLKPACTGCKAHCIDKDAEKSFWNNLSNNTSLRVFWLSYPGLVVAYGCLSSVMDTLDATREPSLKVIVLAALAGSAALSYSAFSLLSKIIRDKLLSLGHGEDAWILSDQRTRMLASFSAINIYFFYSDPTRYVAGELGADLVKALVLWASSMWLYRGWNRRQEHYKLEVFGMRKLGQPEPGSL